MSQDTSAEDDVVFSSFDVNRMIALSNFFADKRSPRSFRSKLDIAKRFESFPNKWSNPEGHRVDLPSKSILNLIDKMLYANFICIDDFNGYFFDDDRFNKFIREESFDGVEWWAYIDRLVDYID